VATDVALCLGIEAHPADKAEAAGEHEVVIQAVRLRGGLTVATVK
jgi:hypothetical protein